MNELIQELIKQATHVEEPDGLFLREVFDQAKFAELIVRECMLQCIKVENDVELSDYEGGFKDGALLCYQEIQEHFGVEE